MLTGQDVMNFFPAGQGALPVSGPYLLAIQALPMGGRRAEGKLLFAHSDDPELTIQLAKKYIHDNRRLLNLGRTNKLPAKDGPDPSLEREHAAKAQKKEGEKAASKYPDAKGPTSLVAFDLLDISLAKSNTSDRKNSSVTIYVMSNSGQGPSLEIHTIPSQLVRFLRVVSRPPTGTAWRKLVGRSWRDPQQKEEKIIHKIGAETGREIHDKQPKKRSKRDGKAASSVPGGPGRSKNDVLADLFPIFDAGFTDLRAARDFIRRHLLRDVRWNLWKGPNQGVVRAQIDETSLVDWNLSRLFLTEVLAMDTKRVEKIRDFADRLGEHIATTKDKRLFQDMVFGRRAWEIRNALTKAQRNEAKDRGALLFGLQDYLDVFEADDAVGVADWSLTRDLVSIRLIETLHQKHFFKEAKDWLENAADTDETRSL
jgi:CRISPR-associated protein Cst1